MDIVREFDGVLVDRDTGAYGRSYTRVCARAKAKRLSIPFDTFLSNRFILNNISEQGFSDPQRSSVSSVSCPVQEFHRGVN